MGRKFFIIGNPSTVWMREYIKEIHIKHKDRVYITVFDESTLLYEQSYEELGVFLVPIGKNSSVLEKINKIIRLLKFAIKHRRDNRFDIIEIHYPPHSLQAYIISLVIRIMKTKTFIMFWGSDILDISPKDAKRLEHIIKASDIINRPGESAYAAFVKHFGYKYEEFFTNTSLRFGTLALPYISKVLLNMQKNECKKSLGLDPSKKSIAIGYNGRTRQQHLQALKAISELNKSEKKAIQLVYHLVGGTEEYKRKIALESQKSGFDYIIIDKMLDFEEIAILRAATDLFLHAQTTDGLSGTIRECLYAGVTVVNPKWISYKELKKIGIDYIEYNSFDELKDLVSHYINGDISINTSKNKELIHKYYSWESLSKEWLEVFQEMK